MPTELQKVPGIFTLPAGWPKLVVPNIETRLYADFDAETLPVGALSAPWKAKAGSPAFTFSNRNNPNDPSPAPVVSVDSNGNKRITFDGTNRLDSNPQPFTAMPAEITMLVTLRPTWWTDPAGGGHVRVVTGSGNFRGIQLSSAAPGEFLTVSYASNPAGIASGLPLGQMTQAAGRFGTSTVTGDVYGVGTTKQAATAPVTDQTYMHIGAAAGNPIAGRFKGDIYRLQIWSRILNDTDLAAAMAENAQRFNIPNPKG